MVDPSTWPQQAGLSPSSAKQINSSQAEQCVDAYLKVVNPASSKDHRQFMLRNLSRDLDCPEKLKASIFTQWWGDTTARGWGSLTKQRRCG